jgi:Putative restriction endonuclease
MAAVLEMQRSGEPPGPTPRVPPLENGDRLTSREFLRRYQAMPGVKKAELIEGIVYMGSPVRIEQHAKPDGIVQTWLGTYAARTPGTENATNATSRLDVDNVPQPDALLRLLPECGGRSRVDEEGYLIGPPELVFEICASSASIDLRDKLKVYRRAGILEYLVWRTTEDRFDWLVLESDDYQASPPDARGLIRSRAFPGLWLDTTALLNQNSAQVLDALQNGLASSEHQHFAQRLIGLRHSGS